MTHKTQAIALIQQHHNRNKPTNLATPMPPIWQNHGRNKPINLAIPTPTLIKPATAVPSTITNIKPTTTSTNKTHHHLNQQNPQNSSPPLWKKHTTTSANKTQETHYNHHGIKIHHQSGTKPIKPTTTPCNITTPTPTTVHYPKTYKKKPI